MPMRKHLIYWLCLFACLTACKNTSKTNSSSSMKNIELKYAANLSIAVDKEFTTVRIRDPWDTTRLLHTYVLVDRDKELPGNLPTGTVVRVPLKKSVVYSSVHCGLVDEFGALESIAGVCDLQYIRMEKVHQACSSGKMIDLGNGMDPDIEKIIDLHPDAILLSPFENSGGYGRVEKLNIPIIECADYMETSPLGRAEWMRFFGLLYGKTREADSIFQAVETEYNRLKGLVANCAHRPTVLTDLKSGTAWYVPGGRSTTGILCQDAGADYLWKEDRHSGVLPLAFEVVYDKGHDADFWLIRYNQATNKTLSEMKQDYAPYAGFRAFREGEVYGCNTGVQPYYEETPFHPDILLKDLIRIFHPEVLEDYSLRYFEKIKP